MATGSLFSMGGGGTTFENYIQTTFLTSLIIRCSFPGFKNSYISEMALQAKRLGYTTDDIALKIKSGSKEHKVLIQIKHEFSFSLKDKVFEDVLSQFWSDFQNEKVFDSENDKFYVIKENLNKTEVNHVKSLTNWAKAKSSLKDFELEVGRIKAKQKTFDTFKDVLQKVNGSAVSNEDVFHFLKCFEVLAYDFGNPASTHKSYFLELIELSKNPGCRLNSDEIWSVLYEFIALKNKDGGEFTQESITKETFYNYFEINKANDTKKDFRKLMSDGEIILKQFSNHISGFHLDRLSKKEEIVESLSQNNFTVVSGNAGVGKSALIKDIIKEHQENSSVIVLRGDQLNKSHLSEVFSSIGINSSIGELLSLNAIHTSQLVYIDSFEKLLEGENENAFKQLYNLILDYPETKIIASCRRYALDLLMFKYGISHEHSQVIEIPNLNTEELAEVADKFPELNSLIKNPSLEDLISCPKYIEYALKIEFTKEDDFEKISEAEFKNKLWAYVVENINVKEKGLPIKRAIAFSEIAVSRAKKMSLYVYPEVSDEEALNKLEEDNLIFRNKHENSFSPTHDILEDWALIRYIQKQYINQTSLKMFFINIGNEPAIRRAFRLWTEESLSANEEDLIHLIRNSLRSDEIENFWADEVLIAVFKSSQSGTFFDTFKVDLLQDKQKLLYRCIHLIRTTCKEYSTENPKLLIPIGSGWANLIKFLYSNRDQIDIPASVQFSILREWEYLILSPYDKVPNEAKYVALLLERFIFLIENQKIKWHSNGRGKYKELISLYFNVAPWAKNSIKKLLLNVLEFEREDYDWVLWSFYEEVIEIALSGVYNKKVVGYYPTILCELAWKTWKYVPSKEKNPFGGTSLDRNEEFGIEQHLKDFPAGIYKTPFYQMLHFYPIKALNFIIEFTNYCFEQYKKNGGEEITKVTLKLPDESTVSQFGSPEIWCAYRGNLRSIPHVLHSLLISLEKFLLETAALKTDKSRALLNTCFSKVYKESSSVATTSVLCSVSMAYPEEVGENLLPLFTVKDFYYWDMSRSTAEYSSLEPYDNEFPFAQIEMARFNRLPHRKAYIRGLPNFIVHYQYYIRTLNCKIHEILDRLNGESNSDDIYWTKLLTEMDIRKFELGKYDKKLGGVEVKPKYREDIKEITEKLQVQQEAENENAIYGRWTTDRLRNEVVEDWNMWLKIYNYYENKKDKSFFFDYPVSHAYLGLIEYKSEMQTIHEEWCRAKLHDALLQKLKASYKPNYDRSERRNFMDDRKALESFSLLLKIIDNQEEKHDFTLNIFQFLIGQIFFNEKLIIIDDLRNNLWETNSEDMMKIISFFPSFSLHKQKQIGKNRQIGSEAVVMEDLEYIANDLPPGIKLLENYDFNQYKSFDYLALSILLINFDTEEKKLKEHYRNFLGAYFDHIRNIDRYHRDRVSYELKSELQKHLAYHLLFQPAEYSKGLFLEILENYFENKEPDISEFISKVLHYLITQLDFIIRNNENFPDIKIPQIVETFWSLFGELRQYLLRNNYKEFSSFLFLDYSLEDSYLSWREGIDEFLPIKGKSLYFKELIEEFGLVNLSSILNIFLSIGKYELLPKGLNWFVDVLKLEPNNPISNRKTEKFIEVLFHEFGVEIKDNKRLLNNYLWLLDYLIDSGSSKAYLIRENIITYKTSIIL